MQVRIKKEDIAKIKETLRKYKEEDLEFNEPHFKIRRKIQNEAIKYYQK